jgi:dienelactone hydrolase
VRTAALALALAAATLVGAGAARALPEPERVAFASRDVDTAGNAVRIDGLLYRPPGAPAGGVPAVVAVHGCAGMWSNVAGHETELSRHNVAWAELLLAEGYAVLFPDSFNPRGQRQVCTIRYGERTIDPPRRRLDVLGALAFLAAQSGIDRERIALVGWSHGGSTTLATINARDSATIAARAGPDAPPFFRAAVAFYPGCGASLRAGSRWQPAVPTRIHIGADDDWTPAQPCVDLGVSMRGRDPTLDVTVYADSYHAFDGPGTRLVVRRDVPNGVHPGQGVTLGPNPAAAAAARASVRAFLREQLGSAPPAESPGRRSRQQEDGWNWD